MSRSTHRVTVLRVCNTPTERRYMEKIKNEYDFEENQLHLFFWYMGYRLCVVNFLGRATSNPPRDAEISKFIDRQQAVQ